MAENIPAVDQKLAIFKDPDRPDVQYAATRGYLGNVLFNIFLVSSTDGVTFTQVPGTGPNGIFSFPAGGGWTVYDPHIAVDTSTKPPTYVMTTECVKSLNTLPYDGFGASLCTSVSKTPWDGSSWSLPHLIIENQGFKSASTGVTLIDGRDIYLQWTVVDDGTNGVDEGTESASTWAAKVSDYSTYKGCSTTAGQLLMWAAQDITCNSAWDCNIVDVQDWRHIGGYYYATYNRANYFRCSWRTAPLTNQWALAIRRSRTALGSYAESTGPIISAERSDICGISYPVLNQIDGKTFLYYAYYPCAGGNKMMRSELVWDRSGVSSTVAQTPATPQFPPDFKPGEFTIRPNTSVLEIWRGRANPEVEFNGAIRVDSRWGGQGVVHRLGKAESAANARPVIGFGEWRLRAADASRWQPGRVSHSRQRRGVGRQYRRPARVARESALQRYPALAPRSNREPACANCSTPPCARSTRPDCQTP